MAQKRVLITAPIPGQKFADFVGNDAYDIKILTEKERAEISTIVKKFQPHAIISLLPDTIDCDIIASSPSLEVVANYAVGYNNIDVKCAKKRGVIVTNTPDVLTDATADIALLLMLMVSRRALESDSLMRNGLFKAWKPSLLNGPSLSGKTLGIVGFGRIGRAVAKRATTFGMKTVYNQRTQLSAEEEKKEGVSYADFETLVSSSDLISLHLPYSADVNHLFNASVFSKMKNGAIFINTARGKLVDEKALVKALQNGPLFGAGLDVYEMEPQFEKELAEMKNTVLFPHIGSATIEAREAMSRIVIDSCIAVLNGEKAQFAV